MNRIVLGTVQFGLDYGVANSQGKVSLTAATEILKCAYLAGINTLDTAIAYGNSEDCLGQIGVRDWKVISKLPDIPHETNDIQHWVKESLQGSLRRLQISQLYGLLLHLPQQLLTDKGQELYNTLIFGFC